MVHSFLFIYMLLFMYRRFIMNKEITMACRDGQLRPGYGITEELTMACRDGQLRPEYGITELERKNEKPKIYKKVA